MVQWTPTDNRGGKLWEAQATGVAKIEPTFKAWQHIPPQAAQPEPIIIPPAASRQSEGQEVARLLVALFRLEKERKKQDDKHELYVVQPGDTLESIAASMLATVSLAGLIYQLNKHKIAQEMLEGELVYALRSKTVLLLPSPNQLRAWSQSRPPRWLKQKTTPANSPFGSKEKEDPKADPPLGGNAPRQGIKAAMMENGPTVTMERDNHPLCKPKDTAEIKPPSGQQLVINSVIEPLTESCRIVKLNWQDCGSQKFVSRLEVLVKETWTPILTYEICDSSSMRYEYKRDGTLVSLPIDLPAPAVHELIFNDLKSNWRSYCRQFLQKPIA